MPSPERWCVVRHAVLFAVFVLILISGHAESRPGIAVSSRFADTTGRKDSSRTAAAAAFQKKLGVLHRQDVIFDLRLESDNRYMPLPVFNTIDPGLLALNPNRKFVSAVNIIGNVTAWGLPLNFNYSTNRSVAYSPSAFGNGLVKFDFDPMQLRGQMTSDLSKYYDLRKKVFSGMDLSGYTSKMIREKLAVEGPGGKLQTNLAQFTADPKNMERLFSLDDRTLKDSLFRIAARDTGYLRAQNNVTGLTGAGKIALSRKDLEAINDDTRLTAFLDSLKGKTLPDSLKGKALEEQLVAHAGLLRDSAGTGDLLKRLAQKMHSDTAQNPVNTIQVMLGREKQADLQRVQLAAQADSTFEVISGIRAGLEKKGYDVRKLFQMQRILNASNGELGTSELTRNYLNTTPVNGLQQLFTNIDAFKLGAFGNQVPGNVQSRDMFQTGTYLTLKSGGIPVTVGYGSINDVGTVKDEGFNNSVYTTPKSFTYIGVQLRRFFDNNNLKVAVIGSYNRQGRSLNAYAIPSISDNNVTFTMSKALSFKNVGHFDLDVSKSTNIASSRYLGGPESILERQNGISYDPSADLFQAMSFGVSHRLDVKAWDFSDNVYFNYSGLGYQNPANTGLGGGKMRLGGNLRKSFYKNKLQVVLRSDLSNRSISYTSSDKWTAFQFQLDGRYLISRKFNIDLKYVNNNTVKQVDHLSTPVYSLQKIQVDGNTNYKIGKNFAVNHLTLSFQGYTNAYTSGGTGNGRGDMLTCSFTQSVLLKKNTLSLNMFYNKELSERKLIGNMLNSDVSYQYGLFHALILTSGMSYLDNSTIARQVGVKQGVQLFAKSNFEANAYVDLRKNLITPQYADLYAACRAELMLSYHIK